MKQRTYGANVTPKQYLGLIIALCTGTLIEWFDFTVYSQLSTVLTNNFFPASNPTAQQLSFWLVYALGFISRPFGSIGFGHIGDAYGRRITMLASIITITLPTILIGCLPTYSQAGLVAPILMGILRFVQGLAVGGEFGSAITYLYEIAPAEHRGLVASLGQQAIAPGIILGIVCCQAVLYACTPAELDLWGWRVPFLVTAVFAPIALILRMHMPEPYEYLQSKQQMVLERVASTAAVRVARRTTSIDSTLSSRQLSMRLQQMTQVVTTSPDHPAAAAAGDTSPSKDHDAASPTGTGGFARAASLEGALKLRVLSGRHSSYVAPPAAAHVPVSSPGAHKQQPLSPARQQQEQQKRLDADGALVPLEAEEDYVAEMQQLGGQIKHHVPLVRLFRDHWRGVLLQFLMEAHYGATFYIMFSWLPSYLHKSAGLEMQMILWAVLLAMVVFAAIVPLTGWACDKGLRKVWAFMGVTAILSAISVPVLLALHTGSLVALWLLLPLMLGSCGFLGGMMTSVGPSIYPAAVRSSGYNFAHNLAMSLFGGLSPLMVSALSVAVKPAAMAAGIILILCGVVAWCASIFMAKVAPQTNARKPTGPIQQPPVVHLSQRQPSTKHDEFEVIVV